MSPISPIPSALLLLAALALAPPARAALKWLPVTDADRSATASTIDPNAGAEILYRLKQVDDSNVGSATTDEYIRIKIYNESGIDPLSKIEIRYDAKTERIKDLAARVIKPDGKIIDVEKKAFYDRDYVKDGSTRWRIWSFAFPALEPGAIAEYRFRRSRDDNILALRFDFTDKMPVRRALFRFKPAPLPPSWNTRSFFHMCSSREQKLAKDNFYDIEMTNLQARADEPFMPPDDDVAPWMIFYPAPKATAKYWNNVASDLSATAAECAKKGGKLVRATAADIARGAAPGRAQAAAINDYCRTQITNIDNNPPPGPPDPKLFAKDPRSLDDILKTKKARAFEIQALYIALAKSLGLDARPALCARRADGIFSPMLYISSCLPDPIVAVKLDNDADAENTWAFYDPTRREVDTGLLHWDNEGQKTLIPEGEKNCLWQTTPVARTEKSRDKSTATLQLDETGALTGDIRIESTGHDACYMRLRYMDETPAKLADKIRDRLQTRLPNIEITDPTATGAADILNPFILTYKIRVPNYAELSGQRIFIQPGFFTKGLPPLFTAPTRTSDICFPYADTEEDEVLIKLPAGYSIEEGSAPQTIKQAAWGRYTVSIGLKPQSRVLVYKRTFECSLRQVPAADYPVIKKLFDFIHTQDSHLLTLHAAPPAPH